MKQFELHVLDMIFGTVKIHHIQSLNMAYAIEHIKTSMKPGHPFRVIKAFEVNPALEVIDAEAKPVEEKDLLESTEVAEEHNKKTEGSEWGTLGEKQEVIELEQTEEVAQVVTEEVEKAAEYLAKEQSLKAQEAESAVTKMFEDLEEKKDVVTLTPETTTDILPVSEPKKKSKKKSKKETV